MTKLHYNLDAPMTFDHTLAVYEDLRDIMPPCNHALPAVPHYADALSDLLEHVDALLLDGFGVLNVGADVVPGAGAMLSRAREKGVIPLVLTNGASKNRATAGLKYRQLGLDIDPDDVISSRDALIHYLIHGHDGYLSRGARLGVIDSFADLPTDVAMDVTALSPEESRDWLTCDAIGFFGALHWSDAWQSALTEAIAHGVRIMVANPDVAAPLQGAFSREPAFWVAKAIHDLGIPIDHAKIDWFGKPHRPVFDRAIERLEQRLGHSTLDRKRIAMVGDTLHTDILGGHAVGLTTVLVTDHGLFRDGGADDTMNSVGIIPDYCVKTV